MSAVMHSNTDLSLVYVRLLGEGTVVLRPTRATPVGPNTVTLLAPENYDPEDEDWEFKPGTTVRVERRTLEGVDSYIAVASVE